jgi:hypothetical protein
MQNVHQLLLAAGSGNAQDHVGSLRKASATTSMTRDSSVFVAALIARLMAAPLSKADIVSIAFLPARHVFTWPKADNLPRRAADAFGAAADFEVHFRPDRDFNGDMLRP